MADMFQTRTMLAAVEQMHRPPKFLDGVIFKRTMPVTTKKVEIDVVKGGKTMAPFVHATLEGKVIQRDSWNNKEYELPYINMKRPTKAGDLLVRNPGQIVYATGAQTPQQRAEQLLGKDISELMGMVDWRIEYMCATALDTGIVTASGDGIEMTFDFGIPSAHKLAVANLSTGVAWSDQTDGDPMTDLEAMCNLAYTDSGMSPDFVIMSVEAAAAFRNHAKISGQTGLMSQTRVNMGQLDPKRLPNGVVYQGFLTGLGVDVYTYNASVKNPATGSPVRLMPANKVWVGSSQARNEIHFAVIEDLEAFEGGPGAAAVEYFPKTWVTKDPSIRWLQLQSAPLAALHQPDAFVSAAVLS
jgi:hypothetical protein